MSGAFSPITSKAAQKKGAWYRRSARTAPKSYRMYRTPRYIGQLAVEFIQGDRNAWAEFEAHGNRQDFEFCNSLDNAAEVPGSRALEADAAGRVEEPLRGSYTEDDIMVVTSAERMDAAAQALEALSVGFTRGESGKGGAVTLVDFMNVKGLERPVVIVTGIEDLYNRSQGRPTFGRSADVETEIRRERLSRRKVYVALTRPTEQLVIYYADRGNVFVPRTSSVTMLVCESTSPIIYTLKSYTRRCASSTPPTSSSM